MPSRPATRIDPSGHALKFTTFAPVGFLNAKNVVSSFAKQDSQSWFARRLPDAERDSVRDAKRRRLMASEEEVEAAAARAGNASSRVDVHVLASAPEGAARRRATREDGTTQGREASPSSSSDPLSRTLVIHPGSRWLRIGRANNLTPVAVPNVIARKTTRAIPTPADVKGKGKAIEADGAGRAIAPNGSTANGSTATSAAPAAPALPAGGALPPLPGAAQPAPTEDTPMRDGDGDDDADSWASGSESGGGTSKPRLSEPTDPLSAKISSIRADLRARMRAYKLRGQGNGNSQAATYNESVRPQEMEEDFEGDIEWTTGEAPVWVGNKAVRIPDPAASGYELRWPFLRGNFNTQGYTTPQELLSDVETIYTTAIREELGIEPEDLKDYAVIFLIPDLYDETYVREVSGLVLGSMGFKQLCLVQESICATFGAGVTSACVIDIGARTTKITCVEEGLVLPETRMILDFAGDDITSFLHTLLQRLNFPYKEADLSKWYDWIVLEDLKERSVVLSEADIGLNLYDFFVRHPGLLTQKYSMRMYDDCILAPYALFAPRVIDFEQKRVDMPALWNKDVDNNIDIGIIEETAAMRNSVKHLLVAAQAAAAAPAAVAALIPPTPVGPGDASTAASPAPSQAGGTPLPDDPNVSTFPSLPSALPALPGQAAPGAAPSSFAGSPAPETGAATPKAAAAPLASPAVQPDAAHSVDVRYESSKLPLDVAIVESIMAAGPTEDRLKKVAANILIVGGTGGIHNIGFAVESRIGPQLAARVPALGGGHVTYVPCPREIEPENMAWKGISALAKLDVANDLWVRKEEWEMLGMRAVRERSFYWT
ncbi:actin-related protein 8 [Rhodotorula toruloides]|uniref:Actin-related protein 8 n=1 Tax=Rhodotorula toruloides TaxID=5286 RepID=A0A511KGB0_RHOTO|nr:actin-related protein 8 [Rhodotorula toruloides]